jgi:hypothetical protein
MNKRILIICFAVLTIVIYLFYYSNASNYNQSDYLSVEEMKSDLRQMKDACLETHPALPDSFNDIFVQADIRLNRSMTISQFSVILAETLAQIGDSHTALNPVFEGPLIPFMIKIIDNNYYVLNDYESITAGSQILSIAGVSLDDIYDDYKKQYSAENKYWEMELFEERYIEVCKVLSLGGKRSIFGGIEISFINGGVERKANLYMKDFVYNQFNDEEREEALYSAYNELLNGKGNNLYYDYFINSEDDYIFFKLRECVYDDGYKVMVSEILENLKRRKIHNLVIDLRGNFGGDSFVFDEFIKQLKNSKRNLDSIEKATEEKINLFVLIDHKTFSSATMFASYVMDLNYGLVIGQPTGGKLPAFGNISVYDLNNSKLSFSVSDSFFKRLDETKNKDDSIYPHILSKYTIYDYVNNIDRDMEIVKSIINGRKIK